MKIFCLQFSWSFDQMTVKQKKRHACTNKTFSVETYNAARAR